MYKYQENYYNTYKMSNYYSVCDAYVHPSDAKVFIENSIISGMYACGGYDYRILSKNNFSFTCAYRTIENDMEYLNVFTPTKTLSFPLA